jgi:hypothetical protein
MRPLPAFFVALPVFWLQGSFHADGKQPAADFQKRAKNSSTNSYGRRTRKSSSGHDLQRSQSTHLIAPEEHPVRSFLWNFI